MTKLTKAEREELRRLHDYAAGRFTMRINGENDCRAELANGPSDDERGMHARFRYATGAHAFVAIHNHLPRLLADLDAAEAERDAERKMRVEAEAAAKRAEEERDALKAKLADPRRVLIHETEVVATKEEIATLKARLADLSEADEELHTCRALVNATSENLRVDLERMVDDLAEANEKAARSEKDSHSWHELYKDTKAKLAALVEAADDVGGALRDIAADAHDVYLSNLDAAIAAARGGAL